MKSIDQVVSKVDIFAQPLEINFEPDRKHGIYLPFVATLALVAIISASTISSLVDLFNYKKVTMTGYRELFAQAELTKATIPMIAIKMDEMSFEQFSDNFFSSLYIEDQHMEPSFLSQNIPLQPCTRSHWKDISDDEFNRFNLLSYYCSSEIDGLSIALTQVSQLRRKIYLQVIQNLSTQYKSHTPKIHILLLNQKSVDKQKLAFENSLKYFTRYSSVRQGFLWVQTVIEFPYIVTNIKDDNSFFPFSSAINNTIATLDSPIIQTQLGEQLWFKIEIYISGRVLEYQRNVGKVTDIFAEAGGLYTSVFGVFSIVVLIYYNHKLRLKLAESTFKDNKNSIKPTDYGFIKSLRYGTRGIVKPDQNSEFANECKRIERNLNEVDSLVHIETMLNRLQILETTLEQSQDKGEFVCSSLLDKSSVGKIEIKRLRIQYFNYVVKGRSGITIQDARKVYNGLGMSLDDFLNRRLKHRMQTEIKSNQGKGKLVQTIQTESGIMNPEIEGSQRISTQTLIIFKQNKSDLNTLLKVINQFRDIKEEAEQVQMTPEFAKIEVSLAKAFYKLKQKSRAKKQQKIPIIILHRLMKAIYKLRMKKQERQQKTKQDGDGKAQQIEKKANIGQEEEEELGDSSDCFDEDD